ncbi:MAG: flagellar biosynthetic protein FliR [Myxococcota bacterium]
MSALVGDQTLIVGALVFARIGPALAVVPALGGRLVPGPAKVAASLAIAALIAPLIAAGTGAAATAAGPVGIFAIALREALIGFALGLIASVGLLAAEAAGRLADTALWPSSREDGPLARLYLLLAAALFFAVSGHRTVLRALAGSYEALPLGAGLASTAGFVDATVRATGGLIAAAIGLAAPVIVALLLADLATGAIGRFVPRANAALLALPARALLAIVAALGTALVLGPGLGRAAASGAQAIAAALRALAR